MLRLCQMGHARRYGEIPRGNARIFNNLVLANQCRLRRATATLGSVRRSATSLRPPATRRAPVFMDQRCGQISCARSRGCDPLKLRRRAWARVTLRPSATRT